MSQSVSRSSIGINSRRGPQKAHVPYRGDDLEHGKRTGKTVKAVSRDADDFEPFQEILDQAYKGDNLPRASSSKRVNGKNRRQSPVNLDGDENGELSMDIDSVQNSPTSYFNNVIAPQASSARRASRSLPRDFDVDYDRVPSPKPVLKRASSQLQNRSRSRHEMRNSTPEAIPHDTYISGDVDDGHGDFNIQGDDADESQPRENISFTELAQTDEVDSPEVDVDDHIAPRMDKGKSRADVQENWNEDDDGGVEADIATGLQEVDDDPYHEVEEYSSGRSNKKSRNEDVPAPRTKTQPPKKQKQKSTRNHQVPMVDQTTYQGGLRRSQRQHYPPLEYWRQERVVWGRREKGPDKGPSFVPVIKEIIRIPKPPPQPLGSKKRKRAGTYAARSKSKSLAPEAKEEIHVIEVDNPELGWDDDTPSHGVIIDMESGGEVQRRVAFTAKMVKPIPAGNSNYLFQKIFGDGDFIAGGQLVIPPGGEKPAKPTKDNTYIFYVISGAVQFRIHRSTFILATGGMFLVPRGNQYYIQNICHRDAKLFFAQARKIAEGEGSVRPGVSVRPRAQSTPHSSSHIRPSPKEKAKV